MVEDVHDGSLSAPATGRTRIIDGSVWCRLRDRSRGACSPEAESCGGTILYSAMPRPRAPKRGDGCPVPAPVASVAHLAHDDDLAVAVVEGRTPTGISPWASGGVGDLPAARRAARTRPSWPACVARRRRRAARARPRTRRSRAGSRPRRRTPTACAVEADADDRAHATAPITATSVHETARSARTVRPRARRGAR